MSKIFKKSPVIYVHQVVHGENYPLFVKNSSSEFVCSLYTKALHSPSVVIHANARNSNNAWEYSIFDTYDDAESHVYKTLITNWKARNGIPQNNMKSKWYEVDIQMHDSIILKENNARKLNILKKVLSTSQKILPYELLERIKLNTFY